MGELIGLLGKEVITALVATLLGVFGGIRFVQEGEKGIKLRFGRAVRKQDKPKIIDPGFVLVIPWVETLRRRHVRQQTIRFQNQKIMLKNGLVFSISAIVIFRVKDIYKALFEIDELDNSVEDLGMGILRDVISALDHTALSDTNNISEQLLGIIKTKADEWGVEFIQFKLTDCAPTAETTPSILAATGTRLKVDALKAAAADLKMQVENLPAGLAAVMIGTPLVATASVPEITVNSSPKES